MTPHDLLIIASLIIIEGVLSVDNAVVLATMVKHLPKDQQKKALRYGIIGAYVFRWLFLVIAFWLMQILWLKLVWWAYLLYLTFKHFFGKEEESHTHGVMKWFWWTVVTVEIVDIVFSLDNVLTAVAMSPKLWVVMTWVFIWILAMRFVAGWFIDLIEKYPALLHSAYIVIGMLWFKLILWFVAKYFHIEPLIAFLGSHITQSGLAVLTIVIFLFPIFYKKCIK